MNSRQKLLIQNLIFGAKIQRYFETFVRNVVKRRLLKVIFKHCEKMVLHDSLIESSRDFFGDFNVA